MLFYVVNTSFEPTDLERCYTPHHSCAVQSVGSMLYCAINTGFAMLVVLFTTPVVVLLVIPLAWLYGRVQGLFITTSRYAQPQNPGKTLKRHADADK